MHGAMLSLLSLFLLPILVHCQKNTFRLNECWCRNDTHIAWNRYYRMDIPYLVGTPAEITEWCIEATNGDGYGECLDQHTKQYSICASYQSVHNKFRRNDFCYRNHGNVRYAKTPIEYYVDGWPNYVGWNEQEYKLTLKNAVHPDTDPEEASKQVSEHCKPVCQQFQGWDLPVMAPWEPSPHGVVESRALSWDYFSFKRGDGAGGHWPLEPFPDEGVHKIHRGGISATSVTGEGTIDYYQCDGQKDGVDRFWNC
ncbi:MAG: hypothetical protein Q9194_006820 [Teloschistes cf. exilis]